MTQSTVSISPRKAAKKPSKPHPDFPLFPHASGRWAKKVRGNFAYFGKVADDPKGEAAIAKWLDQKDDLLAGRTPRVKDDRLTLRDLCNRFVNAKRLQFESGEIVNRSFQDYKRVAERLINQFGKSRLVDDLASDDFENLRSEIDKTSGPTTLGNEITRIRVVFKYGYDAGILEKPMRFGPTFKRPSKKVMRKVRAANGPRMFSASEIQSLLATASAPLKAMILLGINTGFGNADCGTLPMSALDLKEGWINFPRPKTGIHRRSPLWPETVDAVKAAIKVRPEPKNEDCTDLVFVTRYGGSWAKEVCDSPVTKETRKLLDSVNVFECKCGERTLKAVENFTCPKCQKRMRKPSSKGIHRPGLGFYALRHTFRTIADVTRDFPAIDHIMGHARDDMASVYRERIDDERLRAVVGHVRKWLFGSECAA